MSAWIRYLTSATAGAAYASAWWMFGTGFISRLPAGVDANVGIPAGLVIVAGSAALLLGLFFIIAGAWDE